MKRILSLALALIMMLGCVAVLASCEKPCDGNHVDIDGDFLCDNPDCDAVVRREGNYTYNTYMTTFPSLWNPHTYENSTEGEILGYTTVGFYTFDYNENKDGFVVVPEMAAQMPVDVTADYVGDEWGIEDDETARAWKIVLRDDLKWEDGTPITADQFVESARRLLDPKAINHRADSLYSGDMAIMGAKDYFYGGREVTVAATSLFDVYSEDIDSQLIFSLAPPSAATNNAEVYIRTSMGFPASYDAARCAAYLIKNYLDGSAFTADAAAAMEGKTLAEIKADPTMKAAWDALIGWWQTEPNEELHFFLAKDTYPETEWETVGIRAISDTELVIILEDPLEGFYLHYSLTGDFGLVHIPTYDANMTTDELTGLPVSKYATSVDTYMSFGPYKLTYFELDKQIIMERNENWYGYSDPKYAGQYQTTRVVYDWIENNDTAFTAFLQGKLTSKGLEEKHINDYVGADRLYYTDGASTWFVALNPNEAAFAEWEKTHPGYDKSIFTVKEFRMALSFSLNRQDFIKALDPMGSIGLGLFNNMICSNPDLGIMYREEEAAKDALLEFWGISQDDIGPGKLYGDKDEAIDSITGYNLDGAKALFDQAYDTIVEQGMYNGTDKIHITIGLPAKIDFYVNGYEFLKNCWTEAVKGTKLEGKLEFVADDSEAVQKDFSGALKSNVVDVLFGVGWTGSALNPYGLIGAYTQPNYQYDPAWNTATAMMDFVVDGVTYRASVLDWTSAIEGDKVEIAEVGADGELTGEVRDYSCGNADDRPEERILLLAALEGVVLRNYDMIPTHNQASASLLSFKVNYGTEHYVYGVGRGGIRYMTYNYNDEAWDAYVASQGGELNYK